jgi:methylmalonyl-CoA mutase C-terminal domain/subunit
LKSKKRILIAKLGLDGHDRGAKVVARALKDAGMEVIYTGLRNTAQDIVSTALQEDVDLIGISILSGAQKTLLKKLFRLLEEEKIENTPVIIGGIIPQSDYNYLYQLGVKKIFASGTPLSEIVNYVENI